ncbi:MAG: 2OG-Fe(II) oxygenase [Chitinophagaceae bacterium]
MKHISIGDPKIGIRVYENAIKTSQNTIDIIEKSIQSRIHASIKWSPALVGYSQQMVDYRNCWDCKLDAKTVSAMGDECSEFKNMYNEISMSIGECIEDYSQQYSLGLQYMEAINFVKYGVGEFFKAHSDHGFSYICTVSSIAYFNENFEGGELYFNHIDETIKPKEGSIVVFPSTFIYMHASLPVTSGTKYSAVTMFDYNDKFH